MTCINHGVLSFCKVSITNYVLRGFNLYPDVILNTLLCHQYMWHLIPCSVYVNHRKSLWKYITETLTRLELQNAIRTGGRIQIPTTV
jgi:hypothetical protein